MNYTPGKSNKQLAAAIDRQTAALAVLEARAANAKVKAEMTIAQANKAAHTIITEAIEHAERQARAIKVQAEQEAARTKERAYLEGRALADRQRVEHDQRMAGNQRRRALTHTLARKH